MCKIGENVKDLPRSRDRGRIEDRWNEIEAKSFSLFDLI